MTAPQIRFDDGAAYERFMGSWSRPVGEIFLDWLAPSPGLAWVDVGCGNGAFTGLICQRCAPSRVDGIDPSEPQLAYARTRPDAASARFHQGGAEALPFADGEFDVSVMALVIFFVPDPAKGVAELRRVTRPGGQVTAYAWDVPGGGVPSQPFWSAFRALGRTPAMPPHPEVSAPDAFRALWQQAGLADIAMREITLERRFADLESYWQMAMAAVNLREGVASLTEDEVVRLRQEVLAGLSQDEDGGVRFTARAHAISGRVP
jgi:SAM-dependent methyltransferase